MTEINGTRTKKRGLRPLIHLLCALAVMAAALLVRLPSASLSGLQGDRRAVYTDETGLPYLTDMDSYYHVRLVDNYLRGGSLGDSVSENGTPWDSLRFFPEGRSAEYQPGIVYMTAAVWRLLQHTEGLSLAKLEFSLAACMSMFAGLAAWVIGLRCGGTVGGLTAGLLVGCAPAFAVRTAFGRFDTDMFVVLMELLLILFLTEALRAKRKRGRIVFALCFALTAALFGQCWMPKYAMLFAGLTGLGGLLFCLTQSSRGGEKGALKSPALRTLLGCAGLTALAVLISAGPSVFADVLKALSFSTASQTGEGVLPNLFASISELRAAQLFPDSFFKSFLGYTAGAQTVGCGVGGLCALLLSIAGLVRLGRLGFSKAEPAARQNAALYFCVLGVWLVTTLWLTRSGIRFIEHLCIPVGLLCGAYLGMIFRKAAAHSEEKSHKGGKARLFFQKRVLPVLLCAAALAPALSGAYQSCKASRPTVTDASANAMRWVRDNAQEPDAVVASWWDMGYFYESASGHPCLWDGGSQDGIRAVLVSKALTSHNMELSRRILLMLSGSGNAAVERLTAHTDMKTAFETLWKALLLDRAEAEALLRERCNLSAEEAAEAEALLHPQEAKECYLVITYTMTRQLGWLEYYAGWDFTGKQALPATTLYSYTPEGTSVFDTEAGQAYLESVRGKETMWRLFFDAERTSRFTPVYEWHDGLEHVRIWRVNPVAQA